MTDPIVEFKERQRAGWAHFAPLEVGTIPPAARLVRFAGVKPGQRVLDVACGTGVVALTARRVGAKVIGLDLTPELLARAKENGGVKGFEDVVWREGDVEALPFADGEFDVVLSQYGHIFAPRAEIATREMLRVLRPGGTLAFSTWPPEHAVGRFFTLVGKYSPPLPAGASPPALWGDAAVVRERLGAAVRDLTFDRETMLVSALSPAHHREMMERTAGPLIRLVQALATDQQTLAQFRSEMETIVRDYFDPDLNVVRQSYLLTRATKV